MIHESRKVSFGQALQCTLMQLHVATCTLSNRGSCRLQKLSATWYVCQLLSAPDGLTDPAAKTEEGSSLFPTCSGILAIAIESRARLVEFIALLYYYLFRIDSHPASQIVSPASKAPSSKPDVRVGHV
ncbi:hypothetical protein AA313_de0205266 [Arthrobotrys entomopaga]|nr:hypothetical protein AA313_de0205266 [Arthrobotrys entomopaga]